MADDDLTPPVEVHSSPLPDQLWAAARQAIPPVVAFAIGRHWIADDVGTVILAIAGVLAPIIAGQLKTRKRAQQLATIAASPQVPDSVATIKVP